MAALTGKTTVPFNPFQRQWLDTCNEVMSAVTDVGASGRYILGEKVAAFERALSEVCRAEFVIGCASGLDAIELGLRSAGIRQGDLVLTTPLSAFATSLAVVRAGAIPVFVDVDSFGLIDLGLVQDCLSSVPEIKFLLPVHLYGHALNLERLQEFRDQHGITILEDCAQAIGASFRNRPVGSVSAAAALSFYPTKNLGALGDGGALFTDDANIAQRAQRLRDYGQSAKYVHSELGLNSRLDEMQAALMLQAYLPRLEQWTARRKAIAERYISGIRNPMVMVPGTPPGSKSVWHLFPILAAEGKRSELVDHLSDAGVASAVHYPQLISAQSALHEVPFRIFGQLVVAERWASGELSLPISPYLEDTEVDRVIAAVNSWRS